MKPNKYVIGLTGTIASGKSTTAKYLEKTYQIPRIDADLVAREVVEELKYQLAEEFGSEILVEGQLSRPKLGSIVFADAEKLKKLNAMTHPATCRKIQRWVEEQEAKLVLVEAIELLRSELKDMVDTVWVVYAAPQIRVERMMQERGLSEDEARKRVASQWDDATYQAQASEVLDGSHDTQQLYEQCDRLVKDLIE